MTNRYLLGLVLAVLTGCATASSAPKAAAPEVLNKQLAVAFTEEVYNQRLLERIPQYVAEDFIDRSHGAPENARGPAFVRQQAEASLQALPDLKFDIQHLVADEDLVLVHWKASGTDAKVKDAAGQPRPVTLYGHSLFRMREGKIVESWDIADQLPLLLQRGYKVVPPSP
jgi:predicted SnoaL-like aldol condensation-catalyzing enzyme